MTAQIDDLVHFGGTAYALAGIAREGGQLFDPDEHKLHPDGVCSACWRGYLAQYAVRDDALVLDELVIGLPESERDCRVFDRPFEPLPKRDEDDHGIESWFTHTLSGVPVPLEFTGGLLLAREFIDELYVHMGFHPAWKYREVRELVFDAGKLAAAHDRSADMAEARKRFAGSDMPTGENERDVRQWIERVFDRDYFRRASGGVL